MPSDVTSAIAMTIRRGRQPGFTLLEMIVTLTIIALVATFALPRLAADGAVRLSSAARLLRSDVELAQVMTIAHPEDPVQVTFDPVAGSYWLALESDPGTPMPHPDTGEPYLVQLGVGRAAVATETTLTVTDVPGGALQFNAQGGVSDFSLNPVITLTRDNRWVALRIAPTTGAISEAEGEGAAP